ncbi:MAG: hypothetical protein JKY71_03450 [Alphaproteobacteria bacterium]|nr:hypothetical protein [Alphaproteobacteria bacterium]
MLSDRDLARLTNRLQIPLIVQDIQSGRGMLSPDVEFGLHEILSDYQPDAALLCIALSARKVAAANLKVSPTMAVMKMEADRILADYAELWMSHAANAPIHNDDLLDTLENIPEDLEAMAELLEVNTAALREVDEDVAGLCEILAVQAKAHVIVAETYIEVLDTAANDEDALPYADTLPVGSNDNVIIFPGTYAGN